MAAALILSRCGAVLFTLRDDDEDKEAAEGVATR
jgi:hypothetical protein